MDLDYTLKIISLVFCAPFVMIAIVVLIMLWYSAMTLIVDMIKGITRKGEDHEREEI